MSNLLKEILGNVKTRIMFIIFLSIIIISGFFIIYGYFSQLKMYEESELKRLKGIVSSLAIQMDGDEHLKLIENNLWMGDIESVTSDSVYYQIHLPLSIAQKENELTDALYTMYYDDEERVFLYVVRSDDSVQFRVKYEMYPDILLEKMNEGGIINRYETEFGEWLSAFYPIKTKDGRLSGVLQADIEFGHFKALAFDRYKNQGIISLIVIVLMGLFLIPYVRGILKEDEQIKIELFNQKALIEERNKDLSYSVDYASKIQEAMLPDIETLTDVLPNSFVFYKPKDVVSGDFYWFKETTNNTLYVATADCTGHGVPGALMSMIGQSKLNSIVSSRSKLNTSIILDKLDEQVTESLANKNYKTESKDGMDVGVCKIDLSNKKLQFSGAMLNLVRINKQEITEFKGDRFPVGGGDSYQKTEFEVIDIDIQPGDNFYMYSDGFPDQFGGDKEKKYLNKNFKQFLTTLSDLTPSQKIESLEKELIEWQGKIEQLDDVLVIGIVF